MTAQDINHIRKCVRARKPLIHCITNPISINQCANAVLAVGASPMVAEHPEEVAEITATARALVLNLGNITDVRMESMKISAAVAVGNGIPFVLDLVGVACSGLRRKFACELLAANPPAVIKGNYSEIRAMYDTNYHSVGVDAESVGEDQDTERVATLDMGRIAAELARKHNTVVLASGKTDIVTDGRTVIRLKNGVEQLAAVTGTGCMLGALCGCYLAAEQQLIDASGAAINVSKTEVTKVTLGVGAAVTACAVLGTCGELAETTRGNGSFLVNLMDKLSTLAEAEVKKYFRWEEVDTAE